VLLFPLAAELRDLCGAKWRVQRVSSCRGHQQFELEDNRRVIDGTLRKARLRQENLTQNPTHQHVPDKPDHLSTTRWPGISRQMRPELCITTSRNPLLINRFQVQVPFGALGKIFWQSILPHGTQLSQRSMTFRDFFWFPMLAQCLKSLPLGSKRSWG
jgi:hypothetical protein